MGNESSVVKDIERGGASEILDHPWQGIFTFASWFYKYEKQPRQDARTIIELMSDIISKNGNLLLNVELLRDGTIPPEQKQQLDDIGAWINLNSEAIYASKPWKVYGDNLNSFLKRLKAEGVSETDLEALKKQAQSGHFNERTVKSPLYDSDEVRFTTKGDRLFVFVLNPAPGPIELPALGLNSKYEPTRIRSIRMLGADATISFDQQPDKLTLHVPAQRPNKYTTVFELKLKRIGL